MHREIYLRAMHVAAEKFLQFNKKKIGILTSFAKKFPLYSTTTKNQIADPIHPFPY